MLDHVNWVQQEQETEYHVLRWKNSVFHNHEHHRALGGFHISDKKGSAPSGVSGVDFEGIGLGSSRGSREKWRLGGLAQDGLFEDGSGDGRGADTLVLSRAGSEHRLPAADRAREDVPLDVAEKVGTVLMHTAKQKEKPNPEPPDRVREKQVGAVEDQNQGNIKNRLREQAQKFQKAYKRYREKIAGVAAPKPQQTERNQKKGTRAADKEEVLSMQAQNHYLLDSYDKNGKYSVLGK